MGNVYLLLAFVAGIFIPLQAGINAQLANRVDSTVWAAFSSFAGGTIVLLFYVIFFRVTWPTLGKALSIPWWLWTGGALGAYLVWTGILVGPKIGASTLIAFIIAGQLLTSLIFDHFGILGFPIQTMSTGRILGGLLLIAGAMLIKNY